MEKIILASGSPRRKQLLDLIGLEHEVIVSRVDETLLTVFDSPIKTAKNHAYSKAKAVADTITEGIVIGADTIVVKDSKIYNKPKDDIDAFNILKELKGKSHDVITGIAIINAKNGQYILDSETSKVFISQLTDNEIKAYIASGETSDKAGAYAAQGIGSLIVEKIEGCFFNVMGLPLYKLRLLLKNYGINLL